MNDFENALLDEREASTYLKISPRTVQSWRLSGEGPQFVKIGRVVRYRRSDLDAYITSRIVANTAQADRLDSEVAA